ncbi:MAG: tail fiber domain-containing protein [Bacteroidota bacterium]
MKKMLSINSYAFSVFLTCMTVNLYSQNVGIGISSPTRSKLEVHGAVDATNAIFGGETTGISLQRNWPGIGFNAYWNGGNRLMANGYGAMQILIPGTGTMVIDMLPYGTANSLSPGVFRALSISNAGNIAIRTDPVNASLYAIRSGNFDGTAVFGGSAYNSHFYYGNEEHVYIRGGTNSSKVFLNDAGSQVIIGSGNSMVGINSNNPTYTLEISQFNNKGLILVDPDFNFVNWEYKVSYFANDGYPGQSTMGLYYNGQPRGFFRPNGQYSNWSDGRLKTAIKTLPSVLEKISQLQPTVYEMKNHNTNHEKTFGFIAQDVKAIFPALVSIHKMAVDSINQIPDLHGLNLNGLNIIAIKALQEQYDEILELYKEESVLLQRLEALDKKLVMRSGRK